MIERSGCLRVHSPLQYAEGTFRISANTRRYHSFPRGSPQEPDHARDQFCKCGLRCTKQREKIYHALAATDTHPTAEELFWLTRESDRDLSLATVYNALDAFCENGLCRRLATIAGPARYDADVSDHLHVQHPDGTIHDVPEELSNKFYNALGPDLLAEIGSALGLNLSGARIELLAEQPQS